ncbi:MAG: NAD(P)-binding protein [Leptospira sp.]|nr:NAD(P)-binding protein [Leptospira sp.]
MIAIIGSGITGATLASLMKNTTVYDKARFPGGRLASKPFSDGYYCDLGATFFKDKVQILSKSTVKDFSFINWLEEHGINHCKYNETNDRQIYFSPNGQKTISEFLLNKSALKFNHELISFSKLSKDSFNLRFLNGEEAVVDKILITAPIPQALSFFPECEEKEAWETFLKPYSEYRKTLVCACFWKMPSDVNMLEKIQAMDTYTWLDKDSDSEYISIESRKIKNSTSLVFMIQFSEEFSNLHFDNWRNPDRSPTDFCKSVMEEQFLNFCENNQIKIDTFQQVDQWRVHKWRYAQAKYPLLGKNGVLNFDSETFKEYQNITNQTKINILGDWLYGPRIERIVAGVLQNYEKKN